MFLPDLLERCSFDFFDQHYTISVKCFRPHSSAGEKGRILSLYKPSPAHPCSPPLLCKEQLVTVVLLPTAEGRRESTESCSQGRGTQTPLCAQEGQSSVPEQQCQCSPCSVAAVSWSVPLVQLMGECFLLAGWEAQNSGRKC